VHDEDHRFDIGQMIGGVEPLVFNLKERSKAFDDGLFNKLLKGNCVPPNQALKLTNELGAKFMANIGFVFN